jgi:DNA polymerase-3 subunit beta
MITVNTTVLQNALATVSRTVAKRSTLPILGNIHLAGEVSILRLSATNLEQAILMEIPGKVEEPFAITVEAGILRDLVSTFSDSSTVLQYRGKDETLIVESGRSRSTIRGISAGEFPIVPTLHIEDDVPTLATGSKAADSDLQFINLPVAQLTDAIRSVAYAAATDESRPTLTGVEVSLNGKLDMAATDGYRLATRSVETGTDADIKSIVPATALTELANIAKLATLDSNAMIALTSYQAVFCLTTADGRLHFTTSLIDAKFPDYRGIIPKSHKTKTTVSRDELIKALRSARLFARDNANIIRLLLTPDETSSVTVTATSTEMGDFATTIDAKVIGAGLEIAFNCDYLIRALESMPTANVILETTEGNRPGRIVPDNVDGWQAILMPMHPPK